MAAGFRPLPFRSPGASGWTQHRRSDVDQLDWLVAADRMTHPLPSSALQRR